MKIRQKFSAKDPQLQQVPKKKKVVPRKKVPKSKLEQLKAGKDFYVSLGSGSKATDVGITDSYEKVMRVMKWFATSLGNGDHVIHCYLGKNVMDSDPEMFPFNVSINIDIKEGKI